MSASHGGILWDCLPCMCHVLSQEQGCLQILSCSVSAFSLHVPTARTNYFATSLSRNHFQEVVFALASRWLFQSDIV